MENWLRRTIQLGVDIAFLEKEEPSVIPYVPSKTALPTYEKSYFRRVSPERVGVSSARIFALLRELESDREVNLHNFMCIKDGCVISECSARPYSVRSWHLSHSMTKSLIGIGIGMLVDSGVLSLDERVCDLLEQTDVKNTLLRELTVEHLLIMSSGVRFAEVGLVSETEWTRAFFDSEGAFAPGEKFGYNSMNSYILGKVIAKKSGKGLAEFFKERLFDPLGIDSFFWEMGPEGVEKGGMGLYTSIESWCKIGLMMLDGGVLEGRRLLSERWIKEASRVHISTPPLTGAYDYGYHLWVSRDGETYLFSGMFGQDLWINPREKIMVGINAGNNELFQNSPALAIIEKYLRKDLDRSPEGVSAGISTLRNYERNYFESRRWITPCFQGGVLSRLGIRKKGGYQDRWRELLGSYDFVGNNVGVLPLFVRVLQNNLEGGIHSITFAEQAGQLLMLVEEGKETYRLKIGFFDYAKNEIDYRGEKYILSVLGEACLDEDRNLIYKIEIAMPEMPNTRRIKIRRGQGGELVMTMTETPNHEALRDVVRDFDLGGVLSLLYKVLQRRLGADFLEKKLEELFTPTLVGAKRGGGGYDEILAAQGQRKEEKTRANRIVGKIAERFIKSDSGDGVTVRSFLGDIVGKIKKTVPLRFK